jgi:hypothetical protein
MSGKRLHHYIPQFYLRGFTDPSVTGGKTPWLWVRHKESSSVVRKAPKNLAAEIGYYAMEMANGLEYATVENKLAAMESRAAFALRKFLDSPSGHRKIDPDLSAFVGWLTVRVPWFGRAAEDEWQRRDALMAWALCRYPTCMCTGSRAVKAGTSQEVMTPKTLVIGLSFLLCLASHPSEAQVKPPLTGTSELQACLCCASLRRT